MPDGPCDFDSSELIDVGSAGLLAQALAQAAPGDLISMAPGEYVGDFVAETSGTASVGIVLCGPKDAVVRSNSAGSDSFNLQASHWTLSGFTVAGGLRGVVLDQAHHNLITGLTVRDSGQEAIHLRTHSSNNTVQYCDVFNTGTETPGFGEGIYIGSAQSNWAKYTGSASTPDRCDNNRLLFNTIGPNVTAELIDIKEGTTGGLVQGNTLLGSHISGQNYADSWLDVKGNDYQILDNVGTDTPLDGFQTHQVDGWGEDILFRGNIANVNGPDFGFSVDSDASGVVVDCDNEVNGAGNGFANVSCSL
jgi:hypothetical protein